MGRGRSSSWPPAAASLLLLLVCFSHGVAAARPRPLPLQPAAAGLVFQHGEEAAANGANELSGISEMMGGEEEEPAVACAENNNECLERRLLGDAHLDYIYTQHKGKP